jgi:nucleoside-diphosphate-sugar epimerase
VVQDLDPRRDYIYISDLIEALILSADARSGSSFNVGSGISYSVESVIELACALAHIEKPFRALGKTRVNEIDDVVADNSALFEAVGWRPHTSLEEGLRRTIDGMGGDEDN